MKNSGNKNVQNAISRRQFLRHSMTNVSAGVGLGLATAAMTGTWSANALAKNEPTINTGGELLAEPSIEANVVGSENVTSLLDPMKSRRLHLVNAHTWDDLDVVYYTHGIYIDENIYRLNHLMRDRRANVSAPIDTNLYDQLLALQRNLETTEPVHVLSGYRTPETNAKLRRRSKAVAKYSLHMEGRAADIYIPGIPVKKLQQAAIDMRAGGVGLYSRSNFIHIDTGPIRLWGK